MLVWGGEKFLFHHLTEPCRQFDLGDVATGNAVHDLKPGYLTKTARSSRRISYRHDPLLALSSTPLEARARNVAPLAGKSTLNSLEHAPGALKKSGRRPSRKNCLIQ
jgi:hypothetical protein